MWFFFLLFYNLEVKRELYSHLAKQLEETLGFITLTGYQKNNKRHSSSPILSTGAHDAIFGRRHRRGGTY